MFKNMYDEFKTFAMRGNVLDLAIGIILGAAFGSIVNSLVNDIIMPPVGLILGGVDFSNLYINLSGTEYESLAAAMEAGAPTINYGMFLNTVINFLIVAFAVFLLVKGINRMTRRAKQDEAVVEEAQPASQEKLITALERLTLAVEAQSRRADGDSTGVLPAG